MNCMKDIIVILVVLVIILAAAVYVWRQRKKGVQCIACPHAKECAAAKTGGCSGCAKR